MYIRDGMNGSTGLAITGFNIRKAGGGRKKKQEENKDLLTELESIVNPYTRGDPMNPLFVDKQESSAY